MKIRVILVLVALAVMASACGARVTEQQIQAAGRAGASSAGATAPGAGDAVGTGTAAGAATGSPTAAAGGAASSGGAAPQGQATADSVLLGNVSTLSGPVPGLFQGAVIGSQAIVAYQNSKGGLFGRTFKLDVRDDQFDTGQNRSETVDLTKKAFAFLGSFSLYDDAALAEIKASGIPDPTYSLSDARRASPTNFSPQPALAGGYQTAGFKWFAGKFPDAITAVGTLYGDVPSAKSSQLAAKAAAESVGFKFTYERGFQATETDFTADVVRMRQSGVKAVYISAADDKTTARIAKAMQQQGFKPELFITNYMATLPDLAGSAADGTYASAVFSLFTGEDSPLLPEVKLFNQWVAKVKPGYKSDTFAMYAWASGRLLFQAMEAAGPKATRADVIAQLRKINEFSSNNLLSPGGPGAKRPPTCVVISTVKNGKYQRVEPLDGSYRCDGPYHRS
jgi:ABC-type branched-subunit amino acid transport system substrate-binding protein